MAIRGASARSEVSTRDGDHGHRRLTDYLVQVSKYLLIEVLICIGLSVLIKKLGAPPWRLKGGVWHDTVTRVSLWLNLCIGAASIANGSFSKDFRTVKLRVMWLTCFLLSCIGEGLAISIPSTPPLAKLIVAGVANVALIAAHVWPQLSEGIDSAFLSFRYHVEDRALWVSHAILLIETTRNVEEVAPMTRITVIVLAQAIWQVMAWLDALHSAPYHRYALVTTAMLLSHVVSVHMTWQAQSVGMGHASIVLYFFFAASSALYEPRVSLPNFAADKTMNVWSRIIHPSLNPVYTSMPVLAALYYMTQAVQSAIQATQLWTIAVFGIHLFVSQVLLLALRCFRFHQETKERQIVSHPTPSELWVDAVILGIFKALIISGFQEPR